jgi:UDP-2,3-diacylglucosamine pyrophosphatase LpxH
MWLRKQIFKVVLWASNKFASRPDKKRVFDALDDILQSILSGKESKGVVIPFNTDTSRFIIFSDQHKGSGNGADDFLLCEPAYLAALDYYHQHNYQFITLGDCEELWENTLWKVLKKQTESFGRYKNFIAQERFYKVVGNHDLDWKYDPLVKVQMKTIFGTDLPIYDGVLLQTSIQDKPLQILCTHGHQGDKASDGAWFSKFFVAKIWAPLQAWLHINPNTPAYDAQLKTVHNHLMYEWSVNQQALLLITGHTHQPVFESLTHLERLYRQLLLAKATGDSKTIHETEAEIRKRKFEYTHISPDYLTMKPTYFNAGCCCFDDGDITGIEISEGFLRLIKWTRKNSASAVREVLEEESLEALLQAVR